MAIAGIEGLAQGFMQGMAIKRQNDRQDVLDAQNLERFGMDKERFATQQAASAFDLQNAQTNAANAATDRVRSLSIQKKGDDFEANLGKIYGAGTPEGELIALEAIHQGSGVKGAWARDAKTGGLAKSADGKFRWVNEDGTAYDASVEDAVGAYISKVKPLQKAESDMKTASEIAGENRKEKTTIAAEVRAAKTAKEKDALNHSQAMELARLNNNASNGRIKLQLDYKDKKDKAELEKIYSPYLPVAQQFFGKNLKAGALIDMSGKLTKDAFIKNGMDSFNGANINKQLTPAQKLEAQAAMVRLADSLYGAGGNTVENNAVSTLSLLNGLNATNTTDAPSGASLDFE